MSETSAGNSSFKRMIVAGLFVLVAIVASVFVVLNRDPGERPEGAAGPDAGAGRDSAVTDQGEEDWETEVFAEAAATQLDKLAAYLSAAETPPEPVDLVSQQFECDELRPQLLGDVYSDDVIQVKRSNPEAELAQHDSLAEPLAALVALLPADSERHVKFKVTSVETRGSRVTTRVLYQFGARALSRSTQQSAVWMVRWEPREKKTPLIEKIELVEFEELTAVTPTGTLFADCTESVFSAEPEAAKELMRGIDYWRSAIQAEYGVYPYGHHGIAVGDVNADGLEDLYVCQPAGLPNRLFLQNDDGTVSDVAAEMGVDWLDRSRGALLVDLNNNGRLDLVIAVNEMVVILSIDGAGGFVERYSFRPTGDPGSVSATDYDGDGDLDVFVATYGRRFLSDGESSGPIPYHDANNGGENVLLKNDGNWRFRNVTKECGLDENNRKWSFAASWEDFDNDGDPDVYVANDFGRNNLYRNEDGHFRDVAAEAGVQDIGAGMSASWADVNQDGYVDLYVGNMFSSAGQRIAFQDRFHSNVAEKTRGDFQRHARGNSLFHNNGDGTFTDVSVAAGVTLGRWAWASPFVDINNDGLEDIVVANGFVSGTNSGDL